MTNAANKGEALRCLEIAKQALQDNDVAKAKRFAAKALKLCDCAEVSAFLANLDAKPSTNGSASDGPSTSTGTSNGAAKEEGLRQRTASAGSPPKTPSTGSQGSGHTATRKQKELVDKILEHDDFYEILGIEKNADDEEIKKAYKRLALQLHPDKNKAPKAEEAFKAVSRAFSCLSDPEKRSNYDEYGHEDLAQAAAAGHGAHGMHSFYAEDLDPHEVFNMFFGTGFLHPHSRIFRAQFRAGSRHTHTEGSHQSFNFLSLMQMLPLFVLFMYTFLSGPFEPPYKMSKDSQFTVPMNTRRFNVPFYVQSRSQFDKLYPKRSYSRVQLEAKVEASYIAWLQNECVKEKLKQHRVKTLQQFKWEGAAQDIELKHCKQLEQQFKVAAY